MAWIDRLNRRYTITTVQSKDSIVNTFKERIEKANRETSWFSFENINYKKIQVDAYRAIIKKDPIFYSPIGGMGIIVLHFNANIGSTKIIAEVKPVKGGLWVLIGFLIFFSIICLWLIPGANKFLFITFAWVITLLPVYLTIAMYRYRLTNYLKSVLDDVGIHEDLVREHNSH